MGNKLSRSTVKPESEPAPESVSGNETGTKSGNETGTKPGNETGTKSGNETGTKSGNETGTKSEPVTIQPSFENSAETFNTLSRLIIYFSSVIIFEKYIEKTIEKMKNKKITGNFKGIFLELIFKEFWYIPFIIFFYNTFIILFVYVMYFFIYILIRDQNKTDGPSDKKKEKEKNNHFLFNTAMFFEIIKLAGISLIANVIILLLLYLLLIVISNENIRDGGNDRINEKFLKRFCSYYKYAYYSMLLFLFILYQGIDLKKQEKNKNSQKPSPPLRSRVVPG